MLTTHGMSIKCLSQSKRNLSTTSYNYNKSGLSTYKRQGTFDSSIAKLILTKYFEKTSRTPRKG